jgi:putative SOS response-associated peptidase YedK
MCGRFTLATPLDVLLEIFKIQEVDGALQARCNIAPTQKICALRDLHPNRLEWLTWGLIPPWAPGPEIGSRMINSRCETVSQKPSYWRAFRQQRCLILADGFYEWTKR